MSKVKLNIERPDLFKDALETMNRVYKTDFNFYQNNLSENIFEGQVDTEKLNSFYLLGRQYGYSLFKETNKLILTGQKIKISKTIYQDHEQDGFLNHKATIELLNGNKIEFHLGLLGFSESSQFDRVFTVMNNEDKLQIEEFVGIKNYHYKTSFIHIDYNIKYQIINNNLIFFKAYDNKKRIELDSIIEVKWT